MKKQNLILYFLSSFFLFILLFVPQYTLAADGSIKGILGLNMDPSCSESDAEYFVVTPYENAKSYSIKLTGTDAGKKTYDFDQSSAPVGDGGEYILKTIAPGKYRIDIEIEMPRELDFCHDVDAEKRDSLYNLSATILQPVVSGETLDISDLTANFTKYLSTSTEPIQKEIPLTSVGGYRLFETLRCENSNQPLTCFTQAVFKWAQAAIIVLAVGAIVMAGIIYMTSAGNPKRIETAKKLIFGALTGVAVMVLGRLFLTQVIGVSWPWK